MSKTFISLSILFGALALGDVAQAQYAGTATWNGSVSGDWATAANWTPATVPDPLGGYNVILPGGAGSLTITGAAGKFAAMSIQGSGYDIGGSLNLSGQTGAASYIANAGDNTISASYVQTYGGIAGADYNCTSGTLTWNGSASLKNLYMYGNGDMAFNGAVTIPVNTSKYMFNKSGSGSLRFNTAVTGTYYDAIVSGGSVIVNDSVSVDKNGAASAWTVAGSGAMLGGIGLVNCIGSTGIQLGSTTALNLPGILSPGDSLINSGSGLGIGALCVGGVGASVTLGNAAKSNTGTLAIDLGNAGQNDKLIVTGNLNLTAGRSALDIHQLAGTTLGGSYTIANYSGTLSGTFATVTGLPSGYSVDYSAPGQIRLVGPGGPPARDIFTPQQRALIDETHALADARKQSVLTSVVAGTSVWPYDVWGDGMWAMSALYKNQKVDRANALMLSYSTQDAPYSYFDLSDYVRMPTMYGRTSPYYPANSAPGRLTVQTEQAMKEVLYDVFNTGGHDVQSGTGSKVANAALDRVWWTDGSENHDVIRKSTYYLTSAILKDDPNFSTRTGQDGKTLTEHYNAWNTYFQDWLKEKATHGLFIEVGSSTYQKYTITSLMNLYDIAPDPVVRQRAKMLLDLFFIEEAQTSISGRRGGGKSRNEDVVPGFEGYRQLLYGQGGNAGWTKTFETSSYQVPDLAILINNAQPTAPQEIRTRLMGQEMNPLPIPADMAAEFDAMDPNSHLINYAYRTPTYLMGTVLQDPSLTYAGISKQERWSGITFKDLESICVEPIKTDNRTSDAYWSYQYKTAMLFNRWSREEHTGDMTVAFTAGLTKIEQNGWVFTQDNGAFMGVKVVKDGYTWSADGLSMILNTKNAPVIFQSGDTSEYSDLNDFITHVLAAGLVIKTSYIEYTGPGLPKITWYTSATNPAMPKLDGQTVSLDVPYAYDGPYLQGLWGGDIVTATFGDVTSVYDFNNNTITTTPEPATLMLLGLGGLALLRRRQAR